MPYLPPLSLKDLNQLPKTQLGLLPWTTRSRRFKQIILGILFLGPPILILSVSNGFFELNLFSMDPLSASKCVAKGYTQLPCLDYMTTFIPVVKASTVRVVLSLVVSHKWPLHQLDVKKMPFSMAFFMKLFIWSSPRAMLIITIPFMFAN